MPDFGNGKKPEYYSDLVVETLKKLDIDYISANIGATFRGVWESLVNYSDTPVPIHAGHEEVAVGLADGYARAAHKPMAVLIHDLVGMQHATMAIYNAWCDRIPLLLIGATGPMETSKRRPWIDWVHTASIPNTSIRDYVKWDDFVFAPSDIPESIVRAYKTAIAAPQGASYVCLDAGYLDEKISNPVSIPEPEMMKMGEPGVVPPNVIDRIAEMVSSADFPIVIVERTGRNPDSVNALVKLAELASIPVITHGRDVMNFPNMHPFDLTGTKAIEKADLVIALDCPGLEKAIFKTDKATRLSKPRLMPGAKVVRIGLEDQWLKSWSADFQRMVPSDLSYSADSFDFIKELTVRLELALQKISGLKEKIGTRASVLKEMHNAEMESWKARALEKVQDSPISLSRLAASLWETVKDRDWVLVGSELYGWCHHIWSFEKPDSYFGRSTGGGLGTILPISMGVALANKGKGKLVVDIQPDGDFLFSPVALWTAAHYEIPLLIVMFNNRAYYNDAEHNKLVAKSRNRDEEKAFSVGGDIRSPEVDYSKMAESYGVKGYGPIEDPKDLDRILAEAVEYVTKQGKPALVDVICQLR